MSIRTFRGESLAPGFAVGLLHVHVAGSGGYRELTPPARNPQDEVERFQRQIDLLEREIAEAVGRLESEALRAEAEIMRTHMMMLRDPELHRQVLELIHHSRHRAETAIEQVFGGMAAMLACAEDPMLAERSNDLLDLAMRLASGLSPSQDRGSMELLRSQETGCILVLPELMPSIVLEARDRGIAGFVVECGTAVSHGAILAKSFGMPVVRVARIEPIDEFAGRNGLVSGDGEVVVEPTELELAKRCPPKQIAAVTRWTGKTPMRVWASVVDPDQLSSVDWNGIEGVGLYRSETLFMRHRDDFPDERRQFTAYRRLFESAGKRPVVFRTLDLGADKPVEHMRLGPQDNPCLGLRAHRLYRFHPEILITQIRAVLRAAAGQYQLRLLYPMIESIEQLRFVKGLVDQARDSLENDGTLFQAEFLQGVLIETPSAVWSFGRLLEEVDFAGVGTNDLVQYLFAVERNASNVADLYQPEHPVVLQILRSLAQQAAAAGKPLSVCGEMAADPDLLPVLAGLGITDVSVTPQMTEAVLKVLTATDTARNRQLAERCLHADTVWDVRIALGRTSDTGSRVQSSGDRVALDPICGMTVHTHDTPYVLQDDGVTHYFCSRSCLDRFVSRSSNAVCRQRLMVSSGCHDD